MPTTLLVSSNRLRVEGRVTKNDFFILVGRAICGMNAFDYRQKGKGVQYIGLLT